MDDFKCPRCGKNLNAKEIETEVCQECGCLFGIIDPKKGTTKQYSSIVNDTRKMNYRFWIKFNIFFLIIWSFITAFVIVFGFINGQDPWKWIILIFGLLTYVIIFVFIQFQINLIRDTYLLKIKVKELQEKEK